MYSCMSISKPPICTISLPFNLSLNHLSVRVPKHNLILCSIAGWSLRHGLHYRMNSQSLCRPAFSHRDVVGLSALYLEFSLRQDPHHDKESFTYSCKLMSCYHGDGYHGDVTMVMAPCICIWCLYLSFVFQKWPSLEKTLCVQSRSGTNSRLGGNLVAIFCLHLFLWLTLGRA